MASFRTWRGTFILAIALGAGMSAALGASPVPDVEMRVERVVVDGESRSMKNVARGELRLGPGVHRLEFHFSPEPVPGKPAPTGLRFRYRLEGLDERWLEEGDAMRLSVVFFGSSGNILAQHHFLAKGKSPGWAGTPATSSFSKRQEPLAIPDKAARLRVVLASGGTPATTGFMAVDDLRVSVAGGENGAVKEIWPNSALERGWNLHDPGGIPQGWTRGGTQPDCAQVWSSPGPGTNHALCVADTDTAGYGEWFADANLGRAAQPGHLLFLEWKEMFSVSGGDFRAASYEFVPPGQYQFRVLAMSQQGVWTGASASVRVTVLPYFWQTRVFQAALLAVGAGGLLAAAWLGARRRMQRTLQQLERQRALEQERTRIARDIHDDIGASLTQMALLSELAQTELDQPEQVRAHLDHIFTTAHGLTRQLDEIVWAINPAHDTLEEFASFFCKFSQDYLGAASVRCRLDVPESLPARKLSSASRHAVFLCTKEALHNIVKHAAAGEVWLRLRADETALRLWIEDDGKGLCAGQPAGDGLVNMQARMREMGGEFAQRSEPGRGTVTTLTLPWESV